MAFILSIILFLSLPFHCDSHSNACPLHQRLTFIQFPTVRQSKIANDVFSHFVTASVVPRGGDTAEQRDEPPSPTVNDASDGDDAPSKDASFDAAATSERLRREEIGKIKKSQLFLKKQQRRREMDKTWLDRGITATIEFWENVFRWEVVDV
ncbi:hypothetical protein ACHAW6_010837 [Cyclotella cf. meneghiniana]